VDRLPRDAQEVGKPWKQPFGPSPNALRVEIEGEPSFTIEVNMGRGSATMCGMPAINAVRVLSDAPPGLVGPLDVPRHWTRNISAGLGPWP